MLTQDEIAAAKQATWFERASWGIEEAGGTIKL